jgi:nitrilase
MSPPLLTRAVRVAVVQAAPVAFDLDATLARVDERTRDAAAQGAELVLFPEAFVSAYPRGLTFGAVIGSRSEAGRVWYQRYWASSVDLGGDGAARLGAIARARGVHLAIGVVERAGGSLYCSVALFTPDGALAHVHRKLVPTGAERIVWAQGDGRSVRGVASSVGVLGTAVCWEHYMPLLRAALYEDGVQLWLAPTADSRDSWIATVRHIAVEGRCFVLSANQHARRCDYPADYPLDGELAPEAVITRGGSCVVTPYGEVIAGPVYDADALLVADLDLGETVRARLDLDVSGHYARPDVFRLERRVHGHPPES